MNMQAQRTGSTIIKEHVGAVKSLLDKATKKSRNQEEIALLDRLKKRITLLLQTMGEDALIIQMSPFMQDNADNIIGRNEKFFLDIDAKAQYIEKYGVEPKSDDEYLFKLIDIIKALYRKIPQKEKDEVYAEVLKIFNCCIEYQIVASSRFAK